MEGDAEPLGVSVAEGVPVAEEVRDCELVTDVEGVREGLAESVALGVRVWLPLEL